MKGYNIFWDQIWRTIAGLWAGALYYSATRNISRAEHSWTNPLKALQEAMRYSFIKFCIYCFSHRYELFVHYNLRVGKIMNLVLMRDLWNFGFFGRGAVSPTHSNSVALFWVIGQTPGVISRNNFVKNYFCLHRPSQYTLGKMWLDLPSAQVSRIGEQNVHTIFSFPEPLSESETTVLGMFMDYALILDAIRRSFPIKSRTAAKCTSVRVDFGPPPLSWCSSSSLSSLNQEYHLKTFERFTAWFP
jgi:hypothetical protein